MGSIYKDDPLESFELSRHLSRDDYGETNFISDDHDDSNAHLLSTTRRKPAGTRLSLSAIYQSLDWRNVRTHLARRVRRIAKSPWTCSGGLRLILRLFYTALIGILVLVVVIGIFFPSYTHLPAHYKDLRKRVEKSWIPGSANPGQEKIFIAASIYDPGGDLARGDWAKNILNLITILGPHNVYLSIYENDSGDEAMEALAELETKVQCNHTLISEAHLDVTNISNVTLYDGSQHTKRIAYLAEVRNRALRPIETAEIRFDRMLYLNDVMFDPIEAASLLLLTNTNSQGRAQYRSACAVDFINSFKFYDTFATRDFDGFSMGVPFFPWFAAGGGDTTLEDVLSDSDAVRVKSCWGGMVAFDARFFQNWQGEADTISTAGRDGPMNIAVPYRFRAETDLWWDSSECCLIHADIQSPDTTQPGIYTNPYVRVAYDSRSLKWIWLSKRFEKLYTPVHFIVDFLANMPDFNPRRDEIAGQTVQETVWIQDPSLPNNGSWHKEMRTARHDGFCGRRTLQVMKFNPPPGEKNWEFITPPPLIYD